MFNCKFPKIKKSLRDFITDEEGRIEGQSILKTGQALLTVGLGLMGLMNPNATPLNAAHTSHSSHSAHCNHGSHGAHGAHGSHAAHSAHTSHGNHGSHGSHSSHSSHSSGY